MNQKTKAIRAGVSLSITCVCEEIRRAAYGVHATLKYRSNGVELDASAIGRETIGHPSPPLEITYTLDYSDKDKAKMLQALGEGPEKIVFADLAHRAIKQFLEDTGRYQEVFEESLAVDPNTYEPPKPEAEEAAAE